MRELIVNTDEAEYIVSRAMENGYGEVKVLSADELLDLAKSIWTEPETPYSEDEDEETECQRINYINLENGGEEAAVEMLREYEGYTVMELFWDEEQSKKEAA